MSRIIFWDLNVDYSMDDILLFDDDETYEIYNLETALPIPKKKYKLKPNYSLEILKFIKYAICLKNSARFDKTLFLKNNIEFSYWENVVQALNDCNIDSYQKSISKLEAFKVYNKYKVSFETLDLYVVYVLNVVANSLYYNTNSQNKNGSWFTNDLTVISHFNLFLTKRKNTESSFSKHFIESTKALEKTIIKYFVNTKNQDKLYCMSAYCYQIAKNSIYNNQFDRGLLLLQRALDFYYQFLALKNQLIESVSRGIQFSKNTHNYYHDKPVGIYYLEKCLVDAEVICRDVHRNKFTSWLNTMRNTLVLTHGVFNLNAKEVNDALQKTDNTINRIEGSFKWQKLSKEFSFNYIFDNNIILELEPSLEHYYTEI